MHEFQLSSAAQQWVNVVLIWVGFGTLAGLLARVLVPGREPAGAAGTIVIGILGSTAGPFALTYLLKRPDFNPISPVGFLAAIAGAFVLLIGYRLLLAMRRPQEAEEEE
ncbi:MAG: GlsB/YeaQ/YmgE family stress response membrane protein [Pirellulales bacterium]|nr:GlsB/YeaQ/YmgE family stress response membrane protein [Pirellulales bacterium]